MNEKPICLLCGKPLRKNTYSCEVMAGAEPPAILHGKKVLETLRRKSSPFVTDKENLSLWCGEWGGYGDNFFCGLNCGYAWAVMRVKLFEKEDPDYVVRYRKFMKDAENKKKA